MIYGQVAFAIAMLASGVLMIVHGDFYSPWLPIPKWIPERVLFAYFSGVLLVIAGAGLMVKRAAAPSARVLFWFLLAFWLLLKTPPALAEPTVEFHWLDYGQIATLVAGALTLAATSEQQLRWARYLLGAALIPIGLSHFIYTKISMTMVPAILPYPAAWVYFAGSAHIAAGLGILFGVYARLAAILETGMLLAFAALVWLAPLFAAPHNFNLWVEFLVTVVIANGVWAVASKMPAAGMLRR